MVDMSRFAYSNSGKQVSSCCWWWLPSKNKRLLPCKKKGLPSLVGPLLLSYKARPLAMISPARNLLPLFATVIAMVSSGPMVLRDTLNECRVEGVGDHRRVQSRVGHGSNFVDPTRPTELWTQFFYKCWQNWGTLLIIIWLSPRPCPFLGQRTIRKKFKCWIIDFFTIWLIW